MISTEITHLRRIQQFFKSNSAQQRTRGCMEQSQLQTKQGEITPNPVDQIEPVHTANAIAPLIQLR